MKKVPKRKSALLTALDLGRLWVDLKNVAQDTRWDDLDDELELFINKSDARARELANALFEVAYNATDIDANEYEEVAARIIENYKLTFTA